MDRLNENAWVSCGVFAIGGEALEDTLKRLITDMQGFMWKFSHMLVCTVHTFQCTFYLEHKYVSTVLWCHTFSLRQELAVFFLQKRAREMTRGSFW